MESHISGKDERVIFRLTKEERDKLRTIANLFFDGNLSNAVRLLVRMADLEAIKDMSRVDRLELDVDMTTKRGHRLSNERIGELHELRRRGLSQMELAAKFGVSQPHVSRLLSGKYRPDTQP